MKYVGETAYKNNLGRAAQIACLYEDFFRQAEGTKFPKPKPLLPLDKVVAVVRPLGLH